MKRDPLAFPDRPETLPRKQPNLREKLASALLEILALRGHGIPREHAALMSAEQINSLFHFDHDVHHQAGGPCHPANLTPRLRRAHIDKTAKVDVPMIRKGIRLAAAHDAGIARMRAKILGEPTPKPKRKSRWNSRPLSTGRSSWPKKGVRAKNKS